MSSTHERPAGQNPAPLSYPDTDERQRLRAGVVALVVAVTIVVVGALTAAFVFTQGWGTRQPPRPGPPGQLVGSGVAAGGSSARDPASVVLLVSGGSTPNPPAAETFSAAGDTVYIGSGISITPVEGWEVYGRDAGLVQLKSLNYKASLTVWVGRGDSTDSVEELNNDIADLTERSNLTNVKVSPPTTAKLSGKNFQEGTSRGFTADVPSQQGTAQLCGVFVELMNTSTGLSAFILLSTPSADTVKAVANDADTMINSMF